MGASDIDGEAGLNKENIPGSVFRKEAEQMGNQNFGDSIILIHPISHITYAVVASLILIALVSVLALGSYTRKISVPGVVEPVSGVIKVYAFQSGVVKSILVHKGQAVKKGQVLLKISTERHNEVGGNLQSELLGGARDRMAAFLRESGATAELYRRDVETNLAGLRILERGRHSLEQQLAAQLNRVAMAETNHQQQLALKQSGFISGYQLSMYVADLLDQKIRLDSIRREIVNNAADIEQNKRDRGTSTVKANISMRQFERSISSLQGEIAQLSSDGTWTVVAPNDGIVTAINIGAGQTSSPGAPMVSLMPVGTTLCVKLYAPSRALGFIKIGSAVKIKYEAFPYQKFGLAAGRVVNISEVPIANNEFSTSTTILPNLNQSQESVFAIDVKLDKQYITAYGQPAKLYTGMQLEGLVLLERRKLYEWLLEPLLSYSL